MLVALYRGGVPIVAGIDLVVPGHSLHRELEHYVEAGLTPAEALATATRMPAKAMRRDKDLGTIQPGKSAISSSSPGSRSSGSATCGRCGPSSRTAGSTTRPAVESDRVPPLMMRLGDFELTPLLDGYFRLDGGAMFGVVPKTLWEKRAPADERNRIMMAMRPLLVRPASGPLMIIDAGAATRWTRRARDIYGFDRREHLDVTMARAGVRAEDIEIVLASHLHFDHAGGFTRAGRTARSCPASRTRATSSTGGEWEDATHPHERNRASYFAENYVPLQEAGVVHFMDGDGEVMPGVRVRRTGGHTRWHQIVYIESGGKTAVFAADLMPTTAHVDVPWIMAYDLYPMETLEFKRAFVREAIERRVPDLLRARSGGRRRVHSREGQAPVRRTRD